MIKGIRAVTEMAHLISMESDLIELVFQCGVCKKDFHNPDDLEDHLHHDEETDETSSEGNLELTKSKTLENKGNYDSTDDVEIVHVKPSVSNVKQTAHKGNETGVREDAREHDDNGTDESMNTSETQDNLHETSTPVDRDIDKDSDPEILCFYCGQLFDSYKKFRPHLKGHELNEAKTKGKGHRKVSKTKKKDQPSDPMESSISTKEMPILYREMPLLLPETLNENINLDTYEDEGKKQTSKQRRRKPRKGVDTVMALSDLSRYPLDSAEDLVKNTTNMEKQNQLHYRRTRSPAKNTTNMEQQYQSHHGRTRSPAKNTTNVEQQNQSHHGRTRSPAKNTTDMEEQNQSHHGRTRSPAKNTTDMEEQNQSHYGRTRSPAKNTTDMEQQNQSHHGRTRSPAKNTTDMEEQNQSHHGRTRSPAKNTTDMEQQNQSHHWRTRSPAKNTTNMEKQSQSHYWRTKSLAKNTTNVEQQNQSHHGRTRSPAKNTTNMEKQSQSHHGRTRSPAKNKVQNNLFNSCSPQTETSDSLPPLYGASPSTDVIDLSETLSSYAEGGDQHDIDVERKKTTSLKKTISRAVTRISRVNRKKSAAKGKKSRIWTVAETSSVEQAYQVSGNIEENERTDFAKFKERTQTQRLNEKGSKVMSISIEMDKDVGIVKFNRKDEITHKPQGKRKKVKNVSENPTYMTSQLDRDIYIDTNISNTSEKEGNQHVQESRNRTPQPETNVDILIVEQEDILPLEQNDVLPNIVNNVKATGLEGGACIETKSKARSRKKKLNLNSSSEVDKDDGANIQDHVLSYSFHPTIATENEAENKEKHHRRIYGQSNNFQDSEQSELNLYKSDRLSDTSKVHTYVSEKQKSTSKAKNNLMNPSKGKQVPERYVALSDHELLKLYNIKTSIVKLNRVSLFQENSEINDVYGKNEGTNLDRNISTQVNVQTNQGSNKCSMKADKQKGNKDDDLNILKTTCQVHRGVRDSVLESSTNTEVDVRDSVLESGAINELPVDEDLIIERSASNEINSELMMPTNCDNRPKVINTKRKMKKRKGKTLLTVVPRTKLLKPKRQKVSAESENIAHNTLSGQDEIEHNTDCIEGTVSDCLNTENTIQCKDIPVSACEEVFTLNEPVTPVTSPSKTVSIGDPDEIPEEEIEQSLFACGLGTTSPIYSSDSSPNKKSPGARSITSSSSRSPGHCRPLGRLFSRKHRPGRSLPPFSWDEEYQPQESRHKLRSLTKIELAYMNNPHSYFGKTSWLKHNFVSESDSDGDLEVDLPVVEHTQSNTVDDNQGSSTQLNESLAHLPDNSPVHSSLVVPELMSSTLNPVSDVDLKKKYGISEAKVVITKILPTNLCLKSKQSDVSIDSHTAVVENQEENTGQVQTLEVENEVCEEAIDINIAPKKKAILTADCRDVDTVPKGKVRKGKRRKLRKYTVKEPTSITNTLEVDNSHDSIRLKQFNENSSAEKLNSVKPVDGVFVESLAGIVKHLRTCTSKQCPNKQQNEEGIIEKAHSLDNELSNLNDASVSKQKQLVHTMPGDGIVPVFELNNNYSHSKFSQKKSYGEKTAATDGIIMQTCDNVPNKNIEPSEETCTSVHVTKERKCSHHRDKSVTNCTNCLQSRVSTQDTEVNKDQEEGETSETSVVCSKIDTLTTSSEAGDIVKGGDLRMRWNRERGKRCYVQETKTTVQRQTAKSDDEIVYMDAKKLQMDSSSSSGTCSERSVFARTYGRVARDRKIDRQEIAKQTRVQKIGIETESPKAIQNVKRDAPLDENLSVDDLDHTTPDPVAVSVAENQLLKTQKEVENTVLRTEQSLADNGLKKRMMSGKRRRKRKLDQLPKITGFVESIEKTNVHLNMDMENPQLDNSSKATADQRPVTNDECTEQFKHVRANNIDTRVRKLGRSKIVKNIEDNNIELSSKSVDEYCSELSRQEPEDTGNAHVTRRSLKEYSLQQKSCDVSNQIAPTDKFSDDDEQLNTATELDIGTDSTWIKNKKDSDMNKKEPPGKRSRGRAKRGKMFKKKLYSNESFAQLECVTDVSKEKLLTDQSNNIEADITVIDRRLPDHLELLQMDTGEKGARKFEKEKDTEVEQSLDVLNDVEPESYHELETNIDPALEIEKSCMQNRSENVSPTNSCVNKQLTCTSEELVNHNDLNFDKSKESSDVSKKRRVHRKRRKPGKRIYVPMKSNIQESTSEIYIEKEIAPVVILNTAGENQVSMNKYACQSKMAQITEKESDQGEKRGPKKTKCLAVKENDEMMNQPEHLQQNNKEKSTCDHIVTELLVHTTHTKSKCAELLSLPFGLVNEEIKKSVQSGNNSNMKIKGSTRSRSREKERPICVSEKNSNTREETLHQDVYIENESEIIQIDKSNATPENQTDSINEPCIKEMTLASVNNKVTVKKRKGKSKKAKSTEVEEKNGLIDKLEADIVFVKPHVEANSLHQESLDVQDQTSIADSVVTDEDIFSIPVEFMDDDSFTSDEIEKDLNSKKKGIAYRKGKGKGKKGKMGGYVAKKKKTVQENAVHPNDVPIVIEIDISASNISEITEPHQTDTANEPHIHQSGFAQVTRVKKKRGSTKKAKAIVVEESNSDTKIVDNNEIKSQAATSKTADVQETEASNKSLTNQLKIPLFKRKGKRSSKIETNVVDTSPNLLNNPEDEIRSENLFQEDSRQVVQTRRNKVDKANIAMEASPEQKETQISEREIGNRKRGRQKKATDKVVEAARGVLTITESEQISERPHEKENNISENDIYSEKLYQEEPRQVAETNQNKVNKAHIAMEASPEQKDRQFREVEVENRKKGRPKKATDAIVAAGQCLFTVTETEQSSEQPHEKDNGISEDVIYPGTSYQEEQRQVTQTSRYKVDKAHATMEASPEQKDTNISKREVGNRKKGMPKKATDEVVADSQGVLTVAETVQSEERTNEKENNISEDVIYSEKPYQEDIRQKAKTSRIKVDIASPEQKDTRTSKRDIDKRKRGRQKKATDEVVAAGQGAFTVAESEQRSEQPQEKDNDISEDVIFSEKSYQEKSRQVAQTSRNNVDKAHIAMEASPQQKDIQISERGVSKRKKGRPKKSTDETVEAAQGVLIITESEQISVRQHEKDNDISEDDIYSENLYQDECKQVAETSRNKVDKAHKAMEASPEQNDTQISERDIGKRKRGRSKKATNEVLIVIESEKVSERTHEKENFIPKDDIYSEKPYQEERRQVAQTSRNKVDKAHVALEASPEQKDTNISEREVGNRKRGRPKKATDEVVAAGQSGLTVTETEQSSEQPHEKEIDILVQTNQITTLCSDNQLLSTSKTIEKDTVSTPDQGHTDSEIEKKVRSGRRRKQCSPKMMKTKVKEQPYTLLVTPEINDSIQAETNDITEHACPNQFEVTQIKDGNNCESKRGGAKKLEYAEGETVLPEVNKEDVPETDLSVDEQSKQHTSDDVSIQKADAISSANDQLLESTVPKSDQSETVSESDQSEVYFEMTTLQPPGIINSRTNTPEAPTNSKLQEIIVQQKYVPDDAARENADGENPKDTETIQVNKACIEPLTLDVETNEIDRNQGSPKKVDDAVEENQVIFSKPEVNHCSEQPKSDENESKDAPAKLLSHKSQLSSTSEESMNTDVSISGKCEDNFDDNNKCPKMNTSVVARQRNIFDIIADDSFVITPLKNACIKKSYTADASNEEVQTISTFSEEGIDTINEPFLAQKQLDRDQCTASHMGISQQQPPRKDDIPPLEFGINAILSNQIGEHIHCSDFKKSKESGDKSTNEMPSTRQRNNNAHRESLVTSTRRDISKDIPVGYHCPQPFEFPGVKHAPKFDQMPPVNLDIVGSVAFVVDKNKKVNSHVLDKPDEYLSSKTKTDDGLGRDGAEAPADGNIVTLEQDRSHYEYTATPLIMTNRKGLKETRVDIAKTPNTDFNGNDETASTPRDLVDLNKESMLSRNKEISDTQVVVDRVTIVNENNVKIEVSKHQDTSNKQVMAEEVLLDYKTEAQHHEAFRKGVQMPKQQNVKDEVHSSISAGEEKIGSFSECSALLEHIWTNQSTDRLDGITNKSTKKQHMETLLQDQETDLIAKSMALSEIVVEPTLAIETTHEGNYTDRKFNSMQNNIVPFEENSGLLGQQTGNDSMKDIKITEKSTTTGNENQKPTFIMEELEFEYLKELETIQEPIREPSTEETSTVDSKSCLALEICTLDEGHLGKKQEDKHGIKQTDFTDLQNMSINMLVADDSQADLFVTHSKSNQTACLTRSKSFLEQICEGNEKIDEIQLNEADDMYSISENQEAVLKDLNLPYDANAVLETLQLDASDLNRETVLANRNARKNESQKDSVHISNMKKEIKIPQSGRDWRKISPKKNILKGLPEKSYHCLSPATVTDIPMSEKDFGRESDDVSKGTQQDFNNDVATFVAASTEDIDIENKDKRKYLQPSKDNAEQSTTHELNFTAGISLSNHESHSCIGLLDKKEVGKYDCHVPIDDSHNKNQLERQYSNLEVLAPQAETEDYLDHVIEVETDLTNVSVDSVNTNFKVQESKTNCKVWSNAIHEGIQSSREDVKNQSESYAAVEQSPDSHNTSTSSVNSETGMPKPQSKTIGEPVRNPEESLSGNTGSSSELSSTDWPNDIVLAFSPLQLTLLERKKLAITRRKRRRSSRGYDRESGGSSSTFESLLSEIGAMVDYEKQNIASRKENNTEALPRATISNCEDNILDNTCVVSEVKTKVDTVCNKKNIKDDSKSHDCHTQESAGVFLDELETNVTDNLVFGYDNVVVPSTVPVLDKEKISNTFKLVQPMSTDGMNMEDEVKVLVDRTHEADCTRLTEVGEDSRKLEKVQSSSVSDVDSFPSVEQCDIKLAGRKRKKSQSDSMQQGKRSKIHKKTTVEEQTEKIALETDTCISEIRQSSHNLTPTNNRIDGEAAIRTGEPINSITSDNKIDNLSTEHDRATLCENQTELRDKSLDETNTLNYQKSGLLEKSFEDTHASEIVKPGNIQTASVGAKDKTICSEVITKNRRKRGRPKKPKVPTSDVETENYARTTKVNMQKINTLQEDVSSSHNRHTSMKDSWKEKTDVNDKDNSNKGDHLANHETGVNVCVKHPLSFTKNKSTAIDLSETIAEKTKSADHISCESDIFVPGTVDSKFPGQSPLQQGPSGDQLKRSGLVYRKKKFSKTISEICSQLNKRHFEEAFAGSDNVLSGNLSVSCKAKGKQKKTRTKSSESAALSEEEVAMRVSKNTEIIKQSEHLRVKLIPLTAADISRHCRRIESTSRLSETDVTSPPSDSSVFSPQSEPVVPDPSLSRDVPSVMSVDGEQIIEQALDMYDDHCNGTNSTDKDSVTEHGSTSTLFDLIESVKDSDGSIYTDDLCDSTEPHGSNIDSENILSELLTSPLSGEELSTYNTQVRSSRSISSETDEEMAAYCDSGEDLLEGNIVVMNDDKLESEHLTGDGVDRFGCVRGSSEEKERDTCKSSQEVSREGSVEHFANVSRISNDVNNISYQLKKVCGKLTSDRIDSFDVRNLSDKKVDQDLVTGEETV